MYLLSERLGKIGFFLVVLVIVGEWDIGKMWFEERKVGFF